MKMVKNHDVDHRGHKTHLKHRVVVDVGSRHDWLIEVIAIVDSMFWLIQNLLLS